MSDNRNFLKRMTPLQWVYLIFGLLLIAGFTTGEARGFRALSIFSFSTWTHSGQGVNHK